MIIDTIRVVLVCLFLPLLILDLAHARGREVRIGIYQNPPKVFVKADGKPAGFIVDIMNQIAREEKWDTEYVFGAWDENLRRLERGDLDIVLDVSHTPERALRFDFNSVPVIETWLQVFTHEGRKIESMKDLEGMRLAVLRDSHQHAYFSDCVRRKFKIECIIQDYPDYPGTVDALRNRRADAIVAGRFFYFSELRGDDIAPTPIIIDPTNIHFAFPRGGAGDLVAAVDRHLSAMKNDPDSAYYQILQDRLSMKLPSVIPQYLIMVLGIVAGFALMFGGATLLLRAKVAVKTKELRLRNRELEQAGAELEAALEQKNMLLGELFHRTKNNMQVICSLLSLQAEASPDPVLRGGLLDAVNRIRAMSMVHERLDQVQDLSRIDLAAYLQDLAVKLRNSLGFSDAETIFAFDMEPISILIDYAIPCGLIINELLTNSFKHAFPDKSPGGKISISLAVREDSVLRIEYRDNGIGFTKAGEDALSDSIGMKIIRGITEHQLKGSVEFSGEGGFSCTIVFNASGYRARV
ncbi:MAG: transporter substrate-binding domain-containing protein [Spirochaetes bacterium]|nr:transporter substrate-binding domain-containing protein [Spirochaetota bacterium]